jgi:hypothetical protein
MNVQPLVAEFLVTCDGTRTAGQAIQAFAANANAPVEGVQKECLGIIRKLLERGFMVAAQG